MTLTVRIPHLDHECPMLSRRQLQVIGYVAAGFHQDEIAALLEIKTETVKSHLKQIFKNFGARNSPHAVSIAIGLGLVLPSEPKSSPDDSSEER